MDTIVILFLIAGVACVGASFIIKEGIGIDSNEKEKIAEEIRSKALSDESLKKVMSKVEKDFIGKLSDIAEDKLGGSDDHMSEIANNKMLAINEMSGQLIEKIEQNHKEVIFLYDMLNEKSDNLKDFSAKIDGLRKELESEEKRIKALNNDLDDKILKIKEVRQTVITKPVQTAQPSQGKSQADVKGISQTRESVPEITRSTVSTQANSLVQMQKKEAAARTELSERQKAPEKELDKEQQTVLAEQLTAEIEAKPEPEEELSINEKIFKMKKEGKQIIEISKALGMGQGEVQLILGLFGK